LGTNTEEYEILNKAGIPAVGFLANASGDWNAIESVSSWMELLGTIFQKEDRAAEIKEMGYQMLEEVQARVSDIPEEEKERVLILYRYSDEQMTVAGNGHFGDFWIEATGGINAADEVEGSPAVNMEQIYAWNPDKIFITNFSSRMPEDLLNNAVDGDDWTSVKAVQDGEVYKIPLGMYRWYPPSSDTPLMLEWFAQKLYPEKFEDVDMNEEVKAYYNQFYGIELTDEDVTSIFNPSREAANGV
ncbi:MAG: ABC transporter substrate-binding protein, partial [Cellulosilyticum sp.]|nr:ABC transporter substrate-binding protein [Cellulosilyticum sp.]